MTDKERLMQLIREGAGGHTFMPIERIAAHLIANGVTIQQWVSVDERMPNDDDYDEHMVISSGEIKAAVYDPDHKLFYKHCFPLFGVTHWLPNPTPPKENIIE